ncbi:hypothetical protein PR048_017066 [Dryococelus australis]|uniref:Uncharacterized protein n=1 Tax=Dryococelus australis TaxID=614101 RepID=A0ABQ9H8M9_9NEOP|nr:hypothetical protein PR048_017066 [Dryococelus australis]
MWIRSYALYAPISGRDSSSPCATFQHDKARPHMAQVTRGFHHVRTLPWLARSSDVSPIEHMWVRLKHQLPPCHSIRGLEHTVQHFAGSSASRTTSGLQDVVGSRPLASRPRHPAFIMAASSVGDPTLMWPATWRWLNEAGSHGGKPTPHPHPLHPLAPHQYRDQVDLQGAAYVPQTNGLANISLVLSLTSSRGIVRRSIASSSPRLSDRLQIELSVCFAVTITEVQGQSLLKMVGLDLREDMGSSTRPVPESPYAPHIRTDVYVVIIRNYRSHGLLRVPSRDSFGSLVFSIRIAPTSDLPWRSRLGSNLGLAHRVQEIIVLPNASQKRKSQLLVTEASPHKLLDICWWVDVNNEPLSLQADALAITPQRQHDSITSPHKLLDICWWVDVNHEPLSLQADALAITPQRQHDSITSPHKLLDICWWVDVNHEPLSLQADALAITPQRQHDSITSPHKLLDICWWVDVNHEPLSLQADALAITPQRQHDSITSPHKLLDICWWVDVNHEPLSLQADALAITPQRQHDSITSPHKLLDICWWVDVNHEPLSLQADALAITPQRQHDSIMIPLVRVVHNASGSRDKLGKRKLTFHPLFEYPATGGIFDFKWQGAVAMRSSGKRSISPAGATVAPRLERPPPTKANQVRFSAGSPGFSQVVIVPDDVTGRRISSGLSRFSHPCIPALRHTHLASPSSALKTPISRAAYIVIGNAYVLAQESNLPYVCSADNINQATPTNEYAYRSQTDTEISGLGQLWLAEKSTESLGFATADQEMAPPLPYHITINATAFQWTFLLVQIAAPLSSRPTPVKIRQSPLAAHGSSVTRTCRALDPTSKMFTSPAVRGGVPPALARGRAIAGSCKEVCCGKHLTTDVEFHLEVEHSTRPHEGLLATDFPSSLAGGWLRRWRGDRRQLGVASHSCDVISAVAQVCQFYVHLFVNLETGGAISFPALATFSPETWRCGLVLAADWPVLPSPLEKSPYLFCAPDDTPQYCTASVSGVLRTYPQFLQDLLPEYLEDVLLDAREAMWFQQNGALASFRHFYSPAFRYALP